MTDGSIERYRADRKLRYAVERGLQRLMEAAFRLGDDGPRLVPEVDWRKVRGLGNVLRHDDDQISDVDIWRIATPEVPELLDRVNALLDARDGGEAP